MKKPKPEAEARRVARELAKLNKRLGNPAPTVADPVTVGLGGSFTAVGSISPHSIDELLRLTAKHIKGEYGDVEVTRLSDSYVKISRVIPTGLPELDAALGDFGGWPMGVLVEIRGRPSSGKTTFTKWLGGRAQLAGVVPDVKDTEHSGIQTFDQGLGLDTDKAVGSKALTMEEVFDKLEAVLKSAQIMKLPLLGIWDSVAATPTREQLDLGYDEEGRRGRRAAFLSEKIPHLLQYLDENTGLVFVNQVRQNQDKGPWGPKWYSPGGMAMEHYCHLRLETTDLGKIKSGATVIGMHMRIKVLKSKIAPPLREATLDLYFDPPRLVATGTEKPSTRRAVKQEEEASE